MCVSVCFECFEGRDRQQALQDHSPAVVEQQLQGHAPGVGLQGQENSFIIYITSSTLELPMGQS